MRSQAQRVVVTLISIVMVLAIAGPATAATTGTTASRASMSSTVRDWLASAGASDRLQVIVSFKSDAGVSRLKGLGSPVESLKSVPMALTTLSAAQIRDVASWSETRSVWDNAELELHLDESTKMVKADRVWAGQNLRTPYTGAGVGVAVIDSGVDATHPDLPYGAKVKKNFVLAANPLGPGEPAEFVEG